MKFGELFQEPMFEKATKLGMTIIPALQRQRQLHPVSNKQMTQSVTQSVTSVLRKQSLEVSDQVTLGKLMSSR